MVEAKLTLSTGLRRREALSRLLSWLLVSAIPGLARQLRWKYHKCPSWV